MKYDLFFNKIILTYNTYLNYKNFDKISRLEKIMPNFKRKFKK